MGGIDRITAKQWKRKKPKALSLPPNNKNIGIYFINSAFKKDLWVMALRFNAQIGAFQPI